MDRSLVILLLACLATVVGATCPYRNQSIGLEVSLSAINQPFGSTHPIRVNGSSTDYYLDLCQPLNLTGNCSTSTNTAVCAVTNSSEYTSYGRLVGVVYSPPKQPLQAATPNVSVNLTFGHGDPVDNSSRRTEVRLTCNVRELSNGSSHLSVNSTDSERLVVSIATGLQCVFNISSSSSSVPVSPTETPLPSPSSSNVTSLPSPTPSNGTSLPCPTANATASPTETSLPMSPTTQLESPSSTLSPESVPTSIPTTLPLPSSQSTNSTSVPSVPTSPPSCHQSSDDCSQTLALALGISVPATAIITFLVTFLVIFGCFKVKKKRTYIALAPTVYFDEEDEQD